MSKFSALKSVLRSVQKKRNTFLIYMKFPDDGTDSETSSHLYNIINILMC